MSTFPLLPPIERRRPIGCACCGHQDTKLPMDAKIAVGFGEAWLLRDGRIAWEEKPNMSFEECWDVGKAEQLAAQDPDHDWRILLFGPLQESEYQRQGPESWVLVREGKGFA